MWQLNILASILVCGLLVGCAAEAAQAEKLKLVVTSSRLPVAGNRQTVVYDGDDTIYVIGGYNGASMNRLTKYSVSTGAVDADGLYKPVRGGAAFMDFDDLIYIGGYGNDYLSAIDRISTVDGTWATANQLPQAMSGVHAAWDRDNGVAYVFGGEGATNQRGVLMYNASSNVVSQVGQLPEVRMHAAVAWDSERKMAYIFGSGNASPSQDILTFNPASGVVTKLAERLPFAPDLPTAVYAEYDDKAIIVDSRGLVSFNPTTQVALSLTVDDWPTRLERPGTVYVPKLDRLYVFGGYGSYTGGTASYRDEISYIHFGGGEGSTIEPSTSTELPSTPEPATTTITTVRPITTEEPTQPPTEVPSTEAPFCPPTGVHNFPYPGNCTLYIRCFDGTAQVLSCGLLLFDKIDSVCKPPSEAVCDEEIPIECPPVGYEAHPHPSSCSSYYECINGNAYQSSCAANTYFDATPELMQCNLAHLALCNAECPPTGIAFVPIRARDCKWYKVCVEGHSANLECGSGEVYSPLESKCVASDAYMCPYANEDDIEEADAESVEG